MTENNNDLVSALTTLRTARNRHYDQRLERLKLSLGVLDQFIGIFEKQALIAGAIIASSLTLLGFLLQYSNGHALSHRGFWWLVLPSWMLLIISVYCVFRQILALVKKKMTLINLVANEMAAGPLQDIELSIQSIKSGKTSGIETITIQIQAEKTRLDSENTQFRDTLLEEKSYLWGAFSLFFILASIVVLISFVATSLPFK